MVAPLAGRPGIYLADVVAGPAGYERLVIDARTGQILERFHRAARMWGPALAARDEEFGEPLPGAVGPWGPGFLHGPGIGPSVRSAYGGPGSAYIPAAVRPYDPREAPAGTKLKPKSVSTERKAPANKAPTANPPLPPPAPRDGVKPDGTGSLASKPGESHEPGHTEVDDALPVAPPIAPNTPAEASDKPKTSIVPPALFE